MSEDTLQSLREILSRSGNPDQVLESLNRLRDLHESAQVPLEQWLDLQLLGLENLQVLYALSSNTSRTEALIFDILLPACLLRDDENQIGVGRYRTLLVKLVDDLPHADRLRIRRRILVQLQKLLETVSFEAACWVITSLGYRDEEIYQSLKEFSIQNNNERGDTALSALTWLGVPEEDRSLLVGELNKRVSERYNLRLVWALARLGDSSSALAIINAWLSTEERTRKTVDASLAFTAIREILNRNVEDVINRQLIWEKCERLVEQDPKELYWDFEIGHIISVCDLEEVIPTVLRWHGHYPEWFAKPNWARYLAQGQLEGCIRPAQLEGWRNVNGEILRSLQRDACLNTNDDGFYTTHELMRKERAWQTLLKAAHAEALTWFDEAVLQERSRFGRQQVMNYLSCFRIDPLPSAVADWITELYDDPASNDGREIAYRLAAVRLARSTASSESFELLLNFGLTSDGKVLTASSDAVAEVALFLIREGEVSVVNTLVRLVSESSIARQRLVSAHALEAIAAFGEYYQYLLPHANLLCSLISDTKRDEFERGTLLNTLSSLTDYVMPQTFREELSKWALEPDRWIGAGSLQVLARRGELEQSSYLLEQALGLKQENGLWYLESNELRQDWVPYFIGFLYSRNPDKFVPAIEGLLSLSNWQPVAQILRWLTATHNSRSKTPAPPVIVDAILRRIEDRQSSFYGETEIFDVLKTVAPTTFAEKRWDKIASEWMSDSLVALANTLGDAVIATYNPGNCLPSLQFLAQHGLYAVRRAAFRAISKQDSSYLYSLCRSWLESPVLELNMRAAEACGWLVSVGPENAQDDPAEIYLRCQEHRERAVREALGRSWEERLNREWSENYLSKISAIEGNDNSEVLNGWCYGDALARIGDDNCRRVLLDRLSHEVLPPNIRYWLKYILEGLEKGWKQVTQKWPEPWVDMTGVIENGTGRFLRPNTAPITMQYSIWRADGATPSELSSWGGIVEASFEHFLNTEEATVEMEDGRSGDIVLTGFTNNTATFVGNGHYPAFRSNNPEN